MATTKSKNVADLENMDVDALFALRAEIDTELDERAAQLRQQLQALGYREGAKRGRPVKGERSSALKGIKVEPKFRGPNGETWAGRGARPKWLSALLDEGHPIEEFAVGEAADEERRVAAAAIRVPRKRGKPVTKKSDRKKG
ncbi:H-NS family nucleoid-associated regulatory protein [Rhodoplanes roseus]|uniref:DNA-binding protein H-NS-like C-terminal domain-containing protein n=1 Tax=Rhodoplanes roseus TaxID=29409 RepID=A0A327KJ76_9BRAD|nr:H-NS histone family protein [Rhodoplanes roseus]RAI38144.1 hypothetical protein CH341_28415 [Rhodoplanes roseus]